MFLTGDDFKTTLTVRLTVRKKLTTGLQPLCVGTMAEANGGATPQTAVETVTPPAAAPAPASSSTTQDNFADRVRQAKSPAETRALIEELRKRPLTQEALQAAKAPKQPAQTPETAPAATEPETAQTPEGTTPSAEETTPAPETPAEPGAETTTTPETTDAGDGEGDDAGDGSIKPPTAKRLRLQLPENDQVGRMAAAFLQRNRDWTLEQALDAARNKLGIKPEPAAEQKTPEQTPESKLPQTVEAVDTQLKQLREARKKANAELRFEDASDLSDQLEDLLLHRSNLERQADRQQMEQASRAEQAFAASEARAVELYPLAADPNSDFGKRMIEIEESFKETGDPTFNDPNKPLIIAQMVAKEMSIAPRRKGAPAAPAKAAAPATPPAPKKGMVPSGSSRTTAPTTNQPPPITQEIQKISTVADLRAMRKKLGLSY
jgi:hypothetical protein